MSKLHSDDKKLRKVILNGAFLRFSFLIIVILLKDTIDPYLLIDDGEYEGRAQWYLQSSKVVFDWILADSLRHSALIHQFWNYFVCFTAKIINSIYAARICNCLFSTIIIYEIYKLTLYLTNETSTALKAAKLYAYLPYSWMFCVFPFKDVFLSCSVLCIILMLVKWQNNIKVSITHITVSIVLGGCTYFTRGGVVEFLILMAISFLAVRFIKNKQYISAIGLVVFALIVIANMGGLIEEAALKKIEDYNTEESVSSGNLSFIQIKAFTDIWKLPFTYLFAMLSPIMLKYEIPEKISWYYLYSLSNITLYPLAFGAMAYVFCKKYNLLYWATTFIIYSAVIALSLQSFRHYFFLFPITVINFACVRSFHSKIVNSFIKWGCALLFLMVLIYSIK